jgi:hypothetical protein
MDEAHALRDDAMKKNPTPPDGSTIAIVDHADPGNVIQLWKGSSSGWVKIIKQ